MRIWNFDASSADFDQILTPSRENLIEKEPTFLVVDELARLENITKSTPPTSYRIIEGYDGTRNFGWDVQVYTFALLWNNDLAVLDLMLVYGLTVFNQTDAP